MRGRSLAKSRPGRPTPGSVVNLVSINQSIINNKLVKFQRR